MNRLRVLLIVSMLAALGACGTLPPPTYSAADDEPVLLIPPPPAPLVEYPPVEPVEPPMPAAEAAAAAAPPAAVTPAAPASSEPASSPPSVGSPPAEPGEETIVIALIADLQRYGGMSADDLKKEVVNGTQLLTRQRTDANRVRLAVVYTLVRTGPQDDQRAAQLLETVTKGTAPGSAMQRQLAAVLLAQVNERLKAVRDEQQKANDALQKLEALRQLERGMLRDRVRSGGGGGGGGGSSGGGG